MIQPIHRSIGSKEVDDFVGNHQSKVCNRIIQASTKNGKVIAFLRTVGVDSLPCFKFRMINITYKIMVRTVIHHSIGVKSARHGS